MKNLKFHYISILLTMVSCMLTPAYPLRAQTYSFNWQELQLSGPSASIPAFCPFYEEAVQGKVKNMWKGPYPEVYKPLENGNLEIIDLILAATPFNSVTPPPNVSAVPHGYPLYLAPYIAGAKGTYTIQVKSNTETISFGNGSDTLKAGVVFNVGQTLSSRNGNFYARLQPNGGPLCN